MIHHVFVTYLASVYQHTMCNHMLHSRVRVINVYDNYGQLCKAPTSTTEATMFALIVSQNIFYQIYQTCIEDNLIVEATTFAYFVTQYIELDISNLH